MSPAVPAQGIANRLASVLSEIEKEVAVCGRRPGSVQLIAVTKSFPPEDAIEAFRAGATQLGENRVQELLSKQEAFAAAGLSASWHLIGTLQKNKVKYVVGNVTMIHSVDSLDLLREISVRSSAKGIVTEVLLQVNISGEETKHGFEPADFPEALHLAAEMRGVLVRGLMTMAPPAEDPESVRPVFTGLARLHDSLKTTLPEECAMRFDVVSMGMSHDFRVAISCGATHVRIGSAIFGSRSANT